MDSEEENSDSSSAAGVRSNSKEFSSGNSKTVESTIDQIGDNGEKVTDLSTGKEDLEEIVSQNHIVQQGKGTENENNIKDVSDVSSSMLNDSSGESSDHNISSEKSNKLQPQSVMNRKNIQNNEAERDGHVNNNSTDTPNFIPYVPNSVPFVVSNNFGNADRDDPKTNGSTDKPKKMADNKKRENTNQPQHNV
ncbi:hypothetical protein FXO38_30182 [Capsicum annuum]|nr:hypothetical protein FXO38_30182 [Capsicum annuum]KAF3632110.1 hypothetical protein FXO37_27670 [Capsicum annuum]